MDGMKELISGIFDSIEKENEELYLEVKDLLPKYIDMSDADNISLFILPIGEKIVKGYIRSNMAEYYDYKSYLDILLNHRFYERHFLKLIEKNEGHACSADKSRTIMKTLLIYYKTGNDIVFNFEQEYTFHLPTTYFRDFANIKSFYLALNEFRYANPLLYMTEFLKIKKYYEQN